MLQQPLDFTGKEIKKLQWEKYRSENYLRVLVQKAKQRAKKRGLEFTITEDDLAIPERCPVLGLILKMNRGLAAANSPSIDRIDNSRGYVPNNVQIISLRANRLKSNGTVEELVKVASYVQGIDRKKCTRCKRWLTLDEFHKGKDPRYKKGFNFSSACKECRGRGLY